MYENEAERKEVENMEHQSIHPLSLFVKLSASKWGFRTEFPIKREPRINKVMTRWSEDSAAEYLEEEKNSLSFNNGLGAGISINFFSASLTCRITTTTGSPLFNPFFPFLRLHYSVCSPTFPLRATFFFTHIT